MAVMRGRIGRKIIAWEPTVAVGSDNPDNVTSAGTTFYSRDFDTEVSADVISDQSVADMTYGAGYGYIGGAWRASPTPTSSDANEQNAGWAGGDNIAVDTTALLTYSYMLYISDELMADIVTSPDPSPNSTWFWQHGNKIIDAQQWNTAGTDAESAEASNRWVIKVRRNGNNDGDPVQFSHLAGGAGAEYYDDGINTNPDLSTMTDEWVWVMHVLDADNLTMSTYYKRSGGEVTLALQRDTSVVDMSGDRLLYTGRGWYAGRNVWGYWDDIVNATQSASKYVSIDRLRVADGWIDPPF